MSSAAHRPIEIGPVRDAIAEKLRLARTAAKMSTRAVAEAFSKQIPISHATIANYESGKSIPSTAVLAVFAELYERPLGWFVNRGESLSEVRYQNLKSSVRVGELHQFEANVQRWVDAYIAIEKRLRRPLIDSLSQRIRGVTAVELAREVRRELDIEDDEPISSLVDVLESFGVRVFEQHAEFGFDGLVAKYGGERLIVLNPAVSNERVRLNLSQEIANIFHTKSAEATSKVESDSFAEEFASHFLLPNCQLKRAFETRSIVRLVQFKERFGTSLATMVYRAEKLGFVTKRDSIRIWTEFTNRGWKSAEPGSVRSDRATRFEQLIEEVISKGRMSTVQVAELAGVRVSEIHARLDQAIGVSSSVRSGDSGTQTLSIFER